VTRRGITLLPKIANRELKAALLDAWNGWTETADIRLGNRALSRFSITPGQPDSLPRLLPPLMEALKKKRVPFG
jgi:hypothetical protein